VSRLLFALLPFAVGLAGAPRTESGPVKCPGCGYPVPDGISPRCPACQSAMDRPSVFHPEPSAPPIPQPDTAAPVVAPVARRIRPIDIACPTCSAAAGAECGRRTMGSKRYHFDRVVAARGGR
jgi:hypothetical protein